MKAFLVSMAATALILSASAAFAADADNDQHKNKTSHVSGNQSRPPPKGNPAAGGQTGHGKSGGSMGTGQTGNNAGRGTTGSTHHQRHVSGGTTQGNATNGKGPNGNGPSGNAGTHKGGTQAATNLRHFHQNMRAKHRFRIGAYHGPRGYHYRHWIFGMTLPTIYFAQDYWISDYSDYGLDDPPDGYVWVRYGPDALLIEEDTGEIVEVEYSVFY